MAGLLDQYLYAKNEQALKMVIWMAQYFENRVRNVIFKYTIERHWTSLNEETGGMNDVLYDLYTVTVKTYILKHFFSKTRQNKTVHAKFIIFFFYSIQIT